MEYTCRLTPIKSGLAMGKIIAIRMGRKLLIKCNLVENVKSLGPMLVLCATLMSGCVIWHDNTLASHQDSEMLTFQTTGAGLLPGMCGFYTGKTTETDAVIMLHGVKDRYLANDFEIIGRTNNLGDKTGYIEVNRKAKTVRIEVYFQGHPFELNGYHHYNLADT